MGKPLEEQKYVGVRHSRLVISGVFRKNRTSYCIVMCDCGETKEVLLGAVMRGNTRSCGCYQKEEISKRTKTHGLLRHSIYRLWHSVKTRCYCDKTEYYKYYGGRGIVMCDEWANDFKAFYDWAVNNGWKKGLQIDRIDNDGNYEPSNCRFITPQKNCRNKRNNVMVFFEGNFVPMIDLSEILNIPIGRFRYWRRRGFNIEEKLINKK